MSKTKKTITTTTTKHLSNEDTFSKIKHSVVQQYWDYIICWELEGADLDYQYNCIVDARLI